MGVEEEEDIESSIPSNHVLTHLEEEAATRASLPKTLSSATPQADC